MQMQEMNGADTLRARWGIPYRPGKVSKRIRRVLADIRELETAAERVRALAAVDVDALAGAAGVRWLEALVDVAGERLHRYRLALETPRGHGWMSVGKPVKRRLVCLYWDDRRSPRQVWLDEQRDSRHGAWKLRVRRELETRLLVEYEREIAWRGGETEIQDRNGEVSLGLLDWQGVDEEEVPEWLALKEPERLLALLGCDGWRYYSRRAGSWRASLRYLCGVDDSGRWAVRVPGTVESVEEALDWLEPAAVKRAREAGREVLRQGDLYVVETTRRYDQRGDGSALPQGSRHRWSKDGRRLEHPEHESLEVPWPARVYAQRTYQMGRGRGIGAAD